jgi:hypothetical protein
LVPPEERRARPHASCAAVALRAPLRHPHPPLWSA